MPESSEQLAVNTIKALAMDAVQKANSGHPGMPMGMADAATVLFTEYLKHDPADPKWPDRDRFILSAGHGSMLIYALLYLTGYARPTIEDIRNFRQLGSPCAGHPENFLLEGVETTTGPLGQGLGNSVGFALAERMLAARFNSGGHEIVDHFTYAVASDGDMQEGVAAEAALAESAEYAADIRGQDCGLAQVYEPWGDTVGGLRAAANLPGFPADSYLDFALAFTFLQGALFATTNAGTDLARDIQTGICPIAVRRPKIRDRGAADGRLGVVAARVSGDGLSVDLDDDVLRAAAAELGTSTKVATVRRALAEIAARPRRLAFLEVLKTADDDLGEAEAMRGAWR